MATSLRAVLAAATIALPPLSISFPDTYFNANFPSLQVGMLLLKTSGDAGQILPNVVSGKQRGVMTLLCFPQTIIWHFRCTVGWLIANIVNVWWSSMVSMQSCRELGVNVMDAGQERFSPCSGRYHYVIHLLNADSSIFPPNNLIPVFVTPPCSTYAC